MRTILDAGDKRALQDQVAFGLLGLFRLSDVCKVLWPSSRKTNCYT